MFDLHKNSFVRNVQVDGKREIFSILSEKKNHSVFTYIVYLFLSVYTSLEQCSYRGNNHNTYNNPKFRIHEQIHLRRGSRSITHWIDNAHWKPSRKQAFTPRVQRLEIVFMEKGLWIREAAQQAVSITMAVPAGVKLIRLEPWGFEARVL